MEWECCSPTLNLRSARRLHVASRPNPSGGARSRRYTLAAARSRAEIISGQFQLGFSS